MSDEVKKQIEGINLDSIIDLKISGGFYSRIHSLLMYLAQTKPQEEFVKALATIKAGEPNDAYSDNLLTVLTLITSIETAAKAQNLIKVVDLPEQSQK